MDFVLGKNPWGVVYPQSDASKINGDLREALERAGGKPKICDLNQYDCGGKGIGKPEFVITFDKSRDTVLVIECKASVKKHESEKRNQPDAFAVDGVLYYAKFIKDYFNVVAIAVSGTTIDNCKISTFDWRKGQEEPQELRRGRDVLFDPENYLHMVKGEKISKKVSIDEIRKLALVMHDSLRALRMPEKEKPVFIAGILIALKDDDFVNNYVNQNSFRALHTLLQDAIKTVLEKSDIRQDKINDIKGHFEKIGRNDAIKDIPLNSDNSLLWFISELDRKIKPMMDYADSAIDALGIFYHEFVKYSGGDGKGLGIVLTPQHLTEFMCDLAGVNKNSRVVDICCGSGAFLVTAMSKMFKNANQKEIERIKREQLYGVESDDDIYTLAIANMIVRGDGKSNIKYGDCFKAETRDWLQEKQLTVGLINPPYSQKGHTELEFVQNMLDLLVPGGTGVVVVPMSCAIGTKFKTERERLFKDHTLKAVFSMPDDIFYSNNASTNVCVMVWTAHKPHDSTKQTFFGYYKDDGFVKAKKLGRIDKFNRWEKIKKEWLDLYENLDVRDGFTAKKPVKWNDEWLCEAYMETDYSKLAQSDFEQTVKNYLAYLTKTSE
ncbi:MAG: SAM-dependent DNA methyltransferase [Alphaproteobacteria bacterium]|nr:SAM-dependent DNA methyltransferase [Alphaproteobacteria bacterium]